MDDFEHVCSAKKHDYVDRIVGGGDPTIWFEFYHATDEKETAEVDLILNLKVNYCPWCGEKLVEDDD